MALLAARGTRRRSIGYRKVPLFYFLVDDGGHGADRLGVELKDLKAARKEATLLAGELLRERPDAFWDSQSWTMAVTDEGGSSLFTITVEGAIAAAAEQDLRGG